MKLLMAIFGITLSTPALAYLDPGTGSMIISAIVGLFATCALAIKTYWYKLVRLFKGSQSVESTEQKVEAQEVKNQPPTSTDSRE